MKFNDLCNRTAPIIAFNVDNMLFKEDSNKPKGIIEKIKNAFKSKDINEEFIDTVNNVWANYDFSVYLVTNSKPSPDLEDYYFSLGINFTKLVSYTGIDNLRRQLNYVFYLYVDCDEELLSVLSCKNAVNMKDLWKYLKTTR